MLQVLIPAAMCGILVFAVGCQSAPERGMSYSVRRAREPLSIDARWDKPAWQGVETIELTHYMGERPEHFPRTQSRLLYDDSNLYVIFRVEDRYVRAVVSGHQGPVCRDSCCEFFFTPGTDVAAGYFNIEMNCGGTMLFNFQRVPRQGAIPIRPADVDRIKIAHSLPKIVEPEIAEPTVWTVEYAVPLDLLGSYLPETQKPAPGVVWRANLYKCADKTSHPHWLTWSPVTWHKPDFHRPEFFGTLRFE